ncbi:ATP-dependent nuclease [Nitrospirillum bahiense]|uniref:Putative AbiEii toxin of type IV toxin-antitoxin system n=1 Tax=Nitrospirillum amazonense TaxID=28077 RepID=A0A560FTQ4_9PROT|nr:ATP-binding protein [Nitrospirillum amazonense]TWB25014.1 putative AbiEii toxin of type IV toxin-antitoxin system [Nitrospirillum amazonense]
MLKRLVNMARPKIFEQIFSGNMRTKKKNNEVRSPVNKETPTITVKSIRFISGTEIAVDNNDIIVFVGSNNSGKSSCLKEIEEMMHNKKFLGKAISKIEIVKSGDDRYIKEYIEKHSSVESSYGIHRTYSGDEYNISVDNVVGEWNELSRDICRFFCRRLKTETRITDSDAAMTFNVLDEAASRPIHALYANKDIEDKVSRYFHAAFGSELIVMKGGGDKIPLYVGQKPNIVNGEDPTTRSYLKKLEEVASPLEEQGDGMRSFTSAILEMLTSEAPSILLIDEPEAFLHPPQARLLGELFAKEKRKNSQIFIATHSVDVLIGLLNAAPNQLRIIRVQKRSDQNQIKELERSKTRSISIDPLMRHSSVLSGIFHNRAIICESDADCSFYQAILSHDHSKRHSYHDALFLHANGKHRMVTLCESLLSLGVPVDIIADIDILSDIDVMKKIISAMGGQWREVEPYLATLRAAINSSAKKRRSLEIKASIRSILDNIEDSSDFPERAVSDINSLLEKSSPWKILKKAGYSAIPSGDASKSMEEIRKYLENIGIWIVPVGELEGFCRTIGGHGPKWVQQVIETKNINTDRELDEARNFIYSIWNRHLHQ